MSAPRPKPVRCWAVATFSGELLLSTVENTRAEARAMATDILGYDWKELRRSGYRTVRCVLSAEQADAA